jgi:hypothetical protein
MPTAYKYWEGIWSLDISQSEIQLLNVKLFNKGKEMTYVQWSPKYARKDVFEFSSRETSTTLSTLHVTHSLIYCSSLQWLTYLWQLYVFPLIIESIYYSRAPHWLLYEGLVLFSMVSSANCILGTPASNPWAFQAHRRKLLNVCKTISQSCKWNELGAQYSQYIFQFYL